jgi:menaquinone-dependent protoporphyrinogen oxidase
MKGLVAYATMAGATENVAAIIAGELRAKGHEVELKKAGEVKSVDAYDFVVAGTGIRVGKPYGQFVKFAGRFSDRLKSKKTALFVVCLTMKEDSPENRGLISKAIEKELGLNPVDVGMFAGEMNFKRIGPILAAIIRKVDKTGNPEGDFKDVAKIREWALMTEAKLR